MTTEQENLILDIRTKAIQKALKQIKEDPIIKNYYQALLDIYASAPVLGSVNNSNFLLTPPRSESISALRSLIREREEKIMGDTIFKDFLHYPSDSPVMGDKTKILSGL